MLVFVLAPVGYAMYRTYVIAAHTFRQAVAQPLYVLLLAAAAAVLILYGVLPFFTLGEDVVMFKAVSLDVVRLAAILLGVVAATRAVYDEIEDRTMLTLMSKPVGRGQVVVGKYLGLLAATGLVVLLLGALAAWLAWRRIPGDFGLPAEPVRTAQAMRLDGLRAMHLAGLAPQLILEVMQVGVLLAIAVALSTRFSLSLTLPAVLVLYLAGNLAPFVEAAAAEAGVIAQTLAWVVATLLPVLATFDMSGLTIYGSVAVPGTSYANDPNAATIGGLWLNVASAGLYFAAYAGFALLLAVLTFGTRDLGGNEG